MYFGGRKGIDVSALQTHTEQVGHRVRTITTGGRPRRSAVPEEIDNCVTYLDGVADELEQETAFQIGKVKDLAKSTAERIRRDSEMSHYALAEAAKRRVRAQLAESAATLARDLISRNFQPSDQGRLINGFMEKLGSGDPR